MMMKKISLKGVKQSFQRRNRSRSSNEELDDDRTNMESTSDKHNTSQSPTLRSPCSACGDGLTTTETKKKERLGLFKTFKKKLTTSFRKKSDQLVDDNCQYMSPQSVRSDKGLRAKRNNKHKVATNEIPSKSNSSTYSYDSVDNCGLSPLNCGGSTAASYANHKVSNFECNTDSAEYAARKDKTICRSKDITRFQSVDFSVKCNSVSNECVVSPDIQVDPLNIYASHCTKSGTSKEDSCTKKDNLGSDSVKCDHIQEPLHLWEVEEAPRGWSLTKELFKLSKFSWYWGPITRTEAEDKLLNQPDGAFLVRDSSDERYLLSLSFRSYGKTWHTRIEHCNGMFSFYAQPDREGYSSIVDLIQNSMNDSQSGIFCYSRSLSRGAPSFTVRLTKPMSRFTQVRTLQYMCRFVIRQYTRYDHIQQLPLPSRIKGWIEENQY